MITIPPFERPTSGKIEVPASKSQLIRSLAAASMAGGRSHLYSATESDDVLAAVGVVRGFGAEVSMDGQPWIVEGVGSHLSPSSELNARESGLTARIALAMAASSDGESRLTVQGRLHDRPFDGLVAALTKQGARVSGESPPFTVRGTGPLWGGPLTVDASQTTQFATALMLIGPTMSNELILDVDGLSGSAGYLDTTSETMARFGAAPTRTTTGFSITNSGYKPADCVMDADASAAVYLLAMAALSRGWVEIPRLSLARQQPDLRVLHLLVESGGVFSEVGDGLRFDGSGVSLEGFDTDLSDAPDGALTVAVMALIARGPSRIRGLGSLRHKESDRLEAFKTEATKLGARVVMDESSLTISPERLHDGVVDSHGDHRIAMAFAVLAASGLAVSVTNHQVVAKTWPDYWQIVDNLGKK